MLKVNGEQIPLNHFPDGTLRLKSADSVTPFGAQPVTVEWRFENNEEMAALMFITKDLQEIGYEVELLMPYIPNARQDRVEDVHDVFTLKYFAEFINSLGFKYVRVLDAHSPVSLALIDRVIQYDPAPAVESAMEDIAEREKIATDDIVPCFPDAGALKRYSRCVSGSPVYGNKLRDWTTGQIKGLQMLGDVDSVKDSIVLIVDDICSYGGTFYYSALKLKELGAKKVYLYITHCENSILQGKLLGGDLIERIYTTDSVFTEQSDRIEVSKYVF